jgi:hypothetical protein
MMSLQKLLFGRIDDRETAVEIAVWAGDAYLITAVLLAVLGLLFSPGLWLAAAAYVLCGCFVRFKLGRVAAIAGVILSVACFFFWAVPLAFARIGATFIFACWIGVRGAQATFKLHGRFGAQGP